MLIFVPFYIDCLFSFLFLSLIHVMTVLRGACMHGDLQLFVVQQQQQQQAI